ncbi:MAG TPA: ubiquinone/menaquinone biosynthesis methyltransferase [Sedimentisphaerales bacterium]|nr:ubiquinone/menaquinone biosynthesis methyltransferase [Sedimentisphaerales bacterium]
MKKGLKLRMHSFIHYPDGKLIFNREMFKEIAPRYNFISRALSLGRDTAWKNQLVEKLPPLPSPDCLDLACGTGDITFRLAKRYPAGSVVGLDLTEAMVACARKRNSHKNVRFTIRNMCRTEFADHSFDIVTGGYALRNAPNLQEALAEIWRVIRPGGTAAFLDFSKPPNPFVQKAEYFLLKTWGGFWGLALHTNPEVYAYIAESLKQFPDSRQLRRYVTEVGFENIWSKRHYFGITETVIFKKPCA